MWGNYNLKLPNDNINTEKKNNKVLWILGWIFFFPAPVMVLIWRKKSKLKKSSKILLTVFFWLALCIPGMINEANNPDTSSGNKNNVKSEESEINTEKAQETEITKETETEIKPERDTETETDRPELKVSVKYDVDNEIDDFLYYVKTEGLEMIGVPDSNKIEIYFSMNIRNNMDEDILVVAPYRVENLIVSGEQVTKEADTRLDEKDGTTYLIAANDNKDISIQLSCDLYDGYSILNFSEDDQIELNLALGSCIAANKIPSFIGMDILCNMPEVITEENAEVIEEAIETDNTDEQEKEPDNSFDKYDAQLAFEKFCKANYRYGVKLHWFTGCIANIEREDGTYFFKVTATITNMFNAKYDTTVEGEVDANGNVISFFEY